jgi:hypothetical protein
MFGEAIGFASSHSSYEFGFSENRLTSDPNQFFLLSVSPTEGRIAVVTNAGWDAVDAGHVVARFCARTSGEAAYGEIVWS